MSAADLQQPSTVLDLLRTATDRDLLDIAFAVATDARQRGRSHTTDVLLRMARRSGADDAQA